MRVRGLTPRAMCFKAPPHCRVLKEEDIPVVISKHLTVMCHPKESPGDTRVLSRSPFSEMLTKGFPVEKSGKFLYFFV